GLEIRDLAAGRAVGRLQPQVTHAILGDGVHQSFSVRRISRAIRNRGIRIEQTNMWLRSGVKGDCGDHLAETCVTELDEESHGLAIGSDIRVVQVAPRYKSVGNRRSGQSFGRSTFYGNAFDSIRILVN